MRLRVRVHLLGVRLTVSPSPRLPASLSPRLPVSPSRLSARPIVEIPFGFLWVLGGHEHVTPVILWASLDRRGGQHRQHGLAELVDGERR